ncbi:hypothetical protein [Streptomyces sp. WMMB 322]|uniref:hypothetical protein n=1 Tax=Streptomyces sp. WMMB 322 TaxID=1286821 RepID=UPI000823D6F1|nr:hypothetical protein [Streptomyces sp. WMMB 322]SCK28861.1 hypothetical protein H180DRAFT_02264 [Streptomyces sp. WMMB 322]
MSFGQGGPGEGPGGSSTPDWGALAEETERERARKRRWMIAGAGALATVVVAGIVAVAVVNEGGSGGRASDKPSETLPTPEDLPSSTAGQPEPTFKDEPPPPPPPRDFVSDAKTDKAPLNVGTLFPAKRVSINGRPYKRASTDTSKGCTDAAHAGLGTVLSDNGCKSLFRATYTRGGLGVTVGIAVFDDAKTAAKVKKQYKPNLVALKGGGVPDFCRTVTCRTTANSFGRYAYFTISGRTNGKPSTESDTQAEQAGRDGSTYAYARILKRGKEQAEASVEQ